MGEKETNAGLGQASPDTGANLRVGDPVPDIDVSTGPNPEPAAVIKTKTKSNQSND
ncbi:MAG: hypothetical protein ABI782_00245 [Anaerolineaceae bacterium]